MELAFAKWEGLGNDFVIVERGVRASDAVALCDRHLGVGADGVLFVGVEGGAAFMRVINADGSTAEMCGNGIRCAARYLVERGLARGPDLVIETDAGPHACVVGPDDVTVAMRPASLVPREIPVEADAPVVGERWRFDSDELELSAVSMGNPHVVTFDDVGDARRRLGPRIERDARFPNGTNVGFARVDAGGLDLSVWERGVGFTKACGTGACAAVVAAVETGRLPRGTNVRVALPGGALRIATEGAGRPITMAGPARHVFDGTVAWNDLV